jgi:hypothetical protein
LKIENSYLGCYVFTARTRAAKLIKTNFFVKHTGVVDVSNETLKLKLN